VSVRVIRGGGAPAPRGRDLAPTARRIDAARYEARLEAERTTAGARAQADAIRAEAERAGLERANAKALAIMASAEQAAASVSERLTQLVVTATKAVAERAIASTLTTSDESLKTWATEALATFAGAKRIQLRANPRSIARLQELRGVELIPDPDLDEQTLVAHTELGDARVELRAQVDAFADAIAELLGKEVRRAHG